MSRTNIQLSRFLQAILVFRPVCYLDQYWFMIIHLWFLIMRSEICFVCTLLVLAAKVLWNVDRPVLFRPQLCECSPILAYFLNVVSVLIVFNLYLKGRRTFSDDEAVPGCLVHASTCTYRAGSTSFWCQHSGKGQLQ